MAIAASILFSVDGLMSTWQTSGQIDPRAYPCSFGFVHREGSVSIDACVGQLTPARSSSGRAAELFSVAQVSLRQFTEFYASLRQFTPGRQTVSVARTPLYASLRQFTPVCARGVFTAVLL